MYNGMENNLKKKKLKKIIIIVASAFILLSLLVALIPTLVSIFYPESNDDYSYNEWLFFEPDYNKNILEDELYLALNRGIHYNRYGSDTVLTEENVQYLPETAKFFYDYFNCLVLGDYETYPNFYTEACLNDENFCCPERFTMQAIYDINVILHSVVGDASGEGGYTEIFEVSYRIFENNGTYRTDILPDETRTRIFEVVINKGEVKINSISFRNNIK